MNIPLLLEVKEHFMQHPDELLMDLWVCGTQCCIAGLVCKMKRPAQTFSRNAKAYNASARSNHAITKKVQAADWFFKNAREELSLTFNQANELFLPYRWPFDILKDYKEALTCQQRAKVLAKRIDLFIASGGTQ